MNILNLSPGQDTGGQQMRLQDAWPAYYPDDQYVSVTGARTYYPIRNKLNLSQLHSKWWPEADVLHLHNDVTYLDRWHRLSTQGKGMVINYHGTHYRTRPEQHLKRMRKLGAVGIVSTVDLWAIAPEETTWVPQCYSREELQAYRKPIDDGIFRIAHMPTNRAIKGTQHLIDAVERLKKEGASVELLMLEKRPNKEVLKLKGTADVYVDQLMLGYGCNAVEAWGMGIPVIAGVDPERCPSVVRQTIPMDTRDRMKELWGGIPFMEATEESLYDCIARHFESSYIREQYALAGYSHFLRWHEASVATTRLRYLYTEAVNRVTS